MRFGQPMGKYSRTVISVVMFFSKSTVSLTFENICWHAKRDGDGGIYATGRGDEGWRRHVAGRGKRRRGRG